MTKKQNKRGKVRRLRRAFNRTQEAVKKSAVRLFYHAGWGDGRVPHYKREVG